MWFYLCFVLWKQPLKTERKARMPSSNAQLGQLGKCNFPHIIAQAAKMGSSDSGWITVLLFCKSDRELFPSANHKSNTRSKTCPASWTKILFTILYPESPPPCPSSPLLSGGMWCDFSWEPRTAYLNPSQMNGQCQSNHQGSEVVVPSWRPSRKILNHLVNYHTWKWLFAKSVGLKVQPSHSVVWQNCMLWCPWYPFWKRKTPSGHVTTLWGEGCRLKLVK